MRRRHRSTYESEEGSYILSVSDMMSGLLFIFIITLVFFVVRYKSINKSLASRDQIRTELLHTVEQRIKDMNIEKNLDVHVDTKSGVITLRDKEDKMFFRSGEDKPEQNGTMAIESLAEILGEILPCYTANIDLCQMPQKPPLEQRTLESVFIEGHTDMVPVGKSSPYESNWDLSTHRAIETYKILIEKIPVLATLENQDGKKIFSVSGYGETRRLSKGSTPKDLAMDRRIDFRLVMSPPEAKVSDLADQLKER